MSKMLKGREAGESASGQVTDELLEEQIVNNANGDGPALTEHFVGKAERQLMEGEHMDIEPAARRLLSQQTLDAIEEWA
jgi:hypothetical protein